MLWHYALWVPAVITYYVIYSWISKQNNELGGKWIYFAFVYGAICPLWIIVSRVSKRLLFDGMLYDNLMFLTYVITLMFLGSHAKFSTHQWIGVVLVMVGSVLMRIESS